MTPRGLALALALWSGLLLGMLYQSWTLALGFGLTLFVVARRWLRHQCRRPDAWIYGAAACHVRGDNKPVALTFDDGPDPNFTPQILDILRDEGVPATFFCIGDHALAHPQIVRRAQQEGHTIANHSLSHARLLEGSLEEIHREIVVAQDVIGAIAGQAPTLFRPPYGERDARVSLLAGEAGLRTVQWSLDPGDWKQPGADQLLKRILERLEPHTILLLHDGSEVPGQDRSQTVDAVRRLIPELKRRGFEFVGLA